MLGLVDTDAACTALEQLPSTFEYWEQSLSRFRSDSELCELNRRAGTPVVVSDILWEVFQAAKEAEAETRGLVNPLIADALIAAGYDRSFDDLGGDIADLGGPIDQPSVPMLADVLENAEEHSLRLPKGARLDFGGVAKGWAAQQSVQALSLYGPALLSAGGDVAVSGRRADGEPWKIGVEDPWQRAEFLEYIYLEQGGVATSGKDYHHWVKAGANQHHIIDPRTGLPAETDVLTATVIAPNCMLAEAFAKVVVISGSQAGLAWLDGDERLAGLLVLDNGQIVPSRRLSAYL